MAGLRKGYRDPTVANISYITKNTLKIDSINVKLGQILFMLWTMVVVCVFIGVALGKKTQHQHTRHPRTLMAWKSLGLANLVLVTLSNKFSLLVVHHLLFHQEIHLHPSRNHCFMIIHYKVIEPLHWIWKYAGAPFCRENAKFWPLSAHFSQIYALLVPFLQA